MASFLDFIMNPGGSNLPLRGPLPDALRVANWVRGIDPLGVTGIKHPIVMLVDQILSGSSSAPGSRPTTTDRVLGPVIDPIGSHRRRRESNRGAKRTPERPKTTEDATHLPSRDVQARQEFRTRPHSGVRGGSPPARREDRVDLPQTELVAGRTRAAMDRFPKELARARAQGAPGVDDLTGAILRGEVDPNLALARGWITEGQYNAIARARDSRAPDAPGAAAPVRAVGSGAFQRGPQWTPRTPQLPERSGAGTSRGLTGQPGSARDVMRLISQRVHEILPAIARARDDLLAQGIVPADKPLRDYTAAERALLEQAMRQHLPERPGTGTIGPLTSGPPFIEAWEQNPRGAMVGFLQWQGIDPGGGSLGVMSGHPVAQWMIDNADTLVMASRVLTSPQPGELAPSDEVITEFMTRILADRAGVEDLDNRAIAADLAAHVQAMVENPGTGLETLIEADAQSGFSATPRADAYFRILYRPVLVAMGANDALLSEVHAMLVEIEREYDGAVSRGYTGRFIDYMVDSGFDPTFGFGGGR